MMNCMLFNRLIVLTISICLCLSGMGCSPAAPKEPPGNPTVNAVTLINPIGPTVIPVIGISSGNIEGNLDINVQYWNTLDEAIGLLAGNDVEFAVLPITNGVNMYASGVDIVLLGVHEWKVFYLLASEDVVFDGWNSLKGKTVYTPTARGQTVDVLTRYALSKENIKPDEEVAFAYAPPQEIVALFKEGKIDYAALPEPFISLALASGHGQVVLDYQDYWSGISGAGKGIPIAGLFVKKDFLNKYPNETRGIADILAESTTWANQNPETAIQASAEELPLPPAVMQSALRRITFQYVPAAEVQAEVISYLQMMQETYPEGVKEIPDSGFFVK
ncbi:abc-type nitrate/sulfonate/bicarbonate transport system, periplasmic component [hydrocarbon metagenome]|uniref:Abc-type nitrate/sulfonate/bicarbonate transport system, periplasmic component n=1 Tax=hydrocarbon metagenome TaxID=938273 RepID=A0A0W8E195_9ZZZZ